MQVGSMSGSNLCLCWGLFRYFLFLESRSYLEVVSASIFLRFRIPLGEQKQSFRIVNNIVSYTSAFLTWTPFVDRGWALKSSQHGSKIQPKKLQNSIRNAVENLTVCEMDFYPKLAPTRRPTRPQKLWRNSLWGLFNMFLLCHVVLVLLWTPLGPILDPTWPQLGLQNRPKRASLLSFLCSRNSCTLKDCPKLQRSTKSTKT